MHFRGRVFLDCHRCALGAPCLVLLDLRVEVAAGSGSAASPARWSAAHWIERTIVVYPVQRQICPEIASRMVASSGSPLPVEQCPRRHHHAGGAEPALQSVALHEALLDGIEFAVVFEALDRADVVPARHRGEHRARLHRIAVHGDDARAAVAGVAAPVGPGQAQLVAEEMDQQHARFHLGAHCLAVDGHVHLHGYASSPVGSCSTSLRSTRSTAVRSVRIVSSDARWRL